MDASQTEIDNSPPPRPRRRLSRRKQWVIAIGLFLLTIASTWMTPGLNPDGSPNGPVYAAAVMGILLTHELGHFLQTLRYRVPATPPFFIPFPGSPFGTMGAVIAQAAGQADRKAMFDIAISGPLAGLIVALPVAWWGITTSSVATLDLTHGAIIFSDPPVLRWMIERHHGPLADNQEVTLNPMLLAGWVGIFITGLNLIPIGQLDGGHILYTLIGRRAHHVAIALVVLAVTHMALMQEFSYAAFLVLLLCMGVRHPPTANDRRELGLFRIVLGWLTVAFVLVSFTPVPIKVLPPTVGVPAAPGAEAVEAEEISGG